MLFPIRTPGAEHARPRAAVRLNCEILEDRHAPAVITVVGTQGPDTFGVYFENGQVVVRSYLDDGTRDESYVTVGDSCDISGLDGSDRFYVYEVPNNIPITINGGCGSDRDVLESAGASGRRWDITSADAGTLSPSITFGHIENLRSRTDLGDRFVMNPMGSISDSIIGERLDVLDYSLWKTDVTIDLRAGTAPGIAVGGDPMSHVWMGGAIGGNGDDTLIGDFWKNILRGGPGNDSLNGRDGADVLIGGDGDDSLVGGPDRDLLIGGRSSGHFIAWGVGDRLDGGNHDDILIGGYTAYDAYTRSADLALVDLIDAWNAWQATGAMASYEARVQALRTGVGVSQAKLNTSTVFDDRGKDTMTGGLGRDWFHTEPPQRIYIDLTPHLNPYDVLVDLAADEFVD